MIHEHPRRFNSAQYLAMLASYRKNSKSGFTAETPINFFEAKVITRNLQTRMPSHVVGGGIKIA